MPPNFAKKTLPQNHKICKSFLPSKVSTIYGIWWCNRACMWHYFLSLFPYIGWCLWGDLLVVWVLGKYVVARLFTVWDIMITHWMSVVSSTLWCLYTLLRSLQRSWEDASYHSIPLDWPQDYWYIQLYFFFFMQQTWKNFHWNLQFSVKLNCWQKNWNACIGTFCPQVGSVVNLICERFFFGWRISLSVQVLVGFILAFGMLFLPETPRYVQAGCRVA